MLCRQCHHSRHGRHGRHDGHGRHGRHDGHLSNTIILGVFHYYFKIPIHLLQILIN